MEVYICDGLANFSAESQERTASIPDTSLSTADSQSGPSEIPPTR